ncbi:MAG: orotate phosphoribosyltransferase [Pseudomonadota bacterium]
MQAYQRAFIELAQQHDALKFGEFTLKSGRVSPYFFNAGAFCSGQALARLGRCYAERIVEADLKFNVLLGPAYKGIPLATTTAVALSDQFGRDTPFAYNRKEAKAHGEGGLMVGAPLEGGVLVIDDVITAGTAVKEVITLIESAGAHLAGVVVGLNRQERGSGSRSAIQELEQSYGVPIISIVDLDHVIEHLEAGGEASATLIQGMKDYRERFGV